MIMTTFCGVGIQFHGVTLSEISQIPEYSVVQRLIINKPELGVPAPCRQKVGKFRSFNPGMIRHEQLIADHGN